MRSGLRRSDFVRDYAPVLRCEIDLIGDAGADIIPIDYPHLDPPEIEWEVAAASRSRY